MMLKRKKLKASALLSSVLVLVTCLIYIMFYQQILSNNIENNQMIIKYLECE